MKTIFSCMATFLVAAGLMFTGCATSRETGPAVPKTTANSRDGYEMVYIPAGEFWMGSPGGEGEANERPRHKVYLDGYYIGKYDVTVLQFQKFCDATGRDMPKQPRASGPGYPVVDVNWFDADAYAGWAGLSLPTEAQWEKAARGGTDTKYWWGDNASTGRANYAKKYTDDGGTTPVGKYAPNPYGLYDMAGNVWQWCRDWYSEGYYAVSPGRDPQGPDTGSSRALRGGSCFSYATFVRPAARGINDPGGRNYWFGFRCARAE